MVDPILFAFGAGVTFLCFAGAYVWLRGRYGPLTDEEEDVRTPPLDEAVSGS
jgi:hypothetical protein